MFAGLLFAMTNPRQPETEKALAGFYDRVRRGKVPKQRRYSRGGVVGSHQHQRRKREQQRRNAGNWRGTQIPLWRPDGPQA